MRVHFQRSISFHLIPRLRIYRRPLLIWLRWLGKSAFVERSLLPSQQSQTEAS